MNICAEAKAKDTQIKNPEFAHKFPKTFLSWWLPVMVWQCLNCNILNGFGIRTLTATVLKFVACRWIRAMLLSLWDAEVCDPTAEQSPREVCLSTWGVLLGVGGTCNRQTGPITPLSSADCCNHSNSRECTSRFDLPQGFSYGILHDTSLLCFNNL
jgi:hypothetical protein